EGAVELVRVEARDRVARVVVDRRVVDDLVTVVETALGVGEDGREVGAVGGGGRVGGGGGGGLSHAGHADQRDRQGGGEDCSHSSLREREEIVEKVENCQTRAVRSTPTQKGGGGSSTRKRPAS